jgi:hypothetical protein
MCGLCGALGLGPAWEQHGVDPAGGEARWRLHREAVASAAELTAVLRSSRVKVTPLAGGGFTVQFPTGGSQTGASLAQVWHLLERRHVAIPDPLQDPGDG